MTYSCTNPDDLHELTSKIEELITMLKVKLPKSEGLILRPEARKRARERAKKICRKYRPIPKSVRRGRHKNDWRYQNRVGKKASELRKGTNGMKKQLPNSDPPPPAITYNIPGVLTGNFKTTFNPYLTIIIIDITPRNWRDPGSQKLRMYTTRYTTR